MKPFTFNRVLTLKLNDYQTFVKTFNMQFEYTSYLIVVTLLVMVGLFYLSPYELKVNEDEDDE